MESRHLRRWLSRLSLEAKSPYILVPIFRSSTQGRSYGAVVFSSTMKSSGRRRARRVDDDDDDESGEDGKLGRGEKRKRWSDDGMGETVWRFPTFGWRPKSGSRESYYRERKEVNF